MTLLRVALLTLLISTSGSVFGQSVEQQKEKPATVESEEVQGRLPLEELQTFADVFYQIREGYVEEVDDSTLFEYAVKGMLEGLDPHSVYMTREAYSDLQTQTDGEFSGLGIEIGRRGSYIEIIAPIDGSPAAEAGLQSGDVILKLDDTSVKGLSTDEAVDLMRGPVGSSIVLEIGRPGEAKPFEVTIIRDKIKIASVRGRLLAPRYGYLRIAQFGRSTGQEAREAIQKLATKSALKGLVIDLRNNPGGVLEASVEVAGLFLNEGDVVSTKGRHPNAGDSYSATSGDLLEGAPIVVLINGGSASASEIVAGALQDRRRGIVMGTRSFGKGSVQTVLPISESRAVKLTTARYYTPNGRSIQAEGIVPDIVVERAQVTSVEGRRVTEADLQGSLAGAGEANPQDEGAESESLASLRENDNQLYEAFTLLRGYTLLAGSMTPSIPGPAQSIANEEQGESTTE
jgi:carboxyl-terminal processing protease